MVAFSRLTSEARRITKADADESLTRARTLRDQGERSTYAAAAAGLVGLALVWLVLPLSLGAVLLLLFLLRRGSASGVSSLLYLVPPATAVEAHLLFGESLPPLSLAGVVVTTVGVALVLRPPGRRSAQRATMGT